MVRKLLVTLHHENVQGKKLTKNTYAKENYTRLSTE